MRSYLLLATLLIFLTPAHPQAALDPNQARTQLIHSLDALAQTQLTARRNALSQIHTQAQAEARQAQVRATMLRLLGPLPARTPLNPKVLGESTLPGLRIQKILFDSQPRFHVTALLYLPSPAPAVKLPAILLTPGHYPNGKAADFTFAAAFARHGFAVLSYDPLGEGERLQYPDPAHPGKSLASSPTGEHSEAGLQPVLLGESVAQYFLWDAIRGVDFLTTRPEIDPARIGAFGCSGGGAVTALLTAIDPRIAAAGTACYLTSFDRLLATLGPQEGEQSTPDWLAPGPAPSAPSGPSGPSQPALDFPDYVELAAPRPYAIVATTEDMFPFAGTLTTEAEARAFYRLFHADAQLAFLHGPGRHANLQPLLSQILDFFTHALHPPQLSAGGPSSLITTIIPEQPAPTALQVTPTGQVATSYPDTATVFSLNLAHARTLLPPKPLTLSELQSVIRRLLAVPPPQRGMPHFTPSLLPGSTSTAFITPDTFTPSPPHPPHARFAAVLLLTSNPVEQPQPGQPFTKTQNRFYDAAESGKAALLLGSRPSPPGTEDRKTPILGAFYLLGLRAQLVGRTLLGLRVEDTLQAIDQLASRPDIDPAHITAEASGHEALVLLHAAALEAGPSSCLEHITLSNLPETYTQLLANPLPSDIAEDLIPGVLLHYDIPDLVRALGSRITIVRATGNPETIPPL